MARITFVDVNYYNASRQEYHRTMKKQEKWRRKILPFVMVLSLAISLGGILTNAWFYQVSYKEVHFETVKTVITYTKPTQVENSEPVVNITLNDDGSKNVSISCFETLSFSDGGYIKRENQVAVLGMEISAEIYRWSFMNLDSFEDMTKGEERLKKRLEWIAFRAGIPQSLLHLQKYRLSIA